MSRRSRSAGTASPFGPAGTPRVVVVGAGFGGIAAGVRLKRAGIDTFTIYESSPGIGGTWWDNTYPGAEVDVASHLYCFSFRPHRWTSSHAKQPELQRYLEATVDELGLRPHLRLGTTVESATWDDERHIWAVALDDGVVECDALISAVGFLNVPRYPGWPGLEDFGGPAFHTARWEHHHDLTDKTVAVVGTGSSATQVVPAIQPLVRRLYVFQRDPGWVMPKGEVEFGDRELARLAVPWRRRLERLRLRYALEKALWGGALFRPGTRRNAARERFCLDYIEQTFTDRPDLRAAVTPTHPFGGKRPVFATTYYPALKEDNVELVASAVVAVTPTGIVDAEGTERQVDVIVLATGFEAASYLARLRVVGRGGRTLEDHWAGEPRAYLGITVPGFPNFFILYGPGTNGGEIVSMLEAQAAYAVAAIGRMRRLGVTAIEVRPAFEARWHRWLQRKMRGTSWTVSRNYFTSPSGAVVTQWPAGNLTYVVLTRLLGGVSERRRRPSERRSPTRRGQRAAVNSRWSSVSPRSM
ncbi:MAG: flavin-containing monooxygenase [Acidimicrobiales bacterium]